MEDKQIISLLLRRSEEALSQISRRFGCRLQQLAQNILLNQQDAQECVNDTYLAVWNSIPPQNPDPLLPYICRLCKNIAISRLRTLTAQKRGGYLLALDELDQAIGTLDLDEAISARELGRAIDRFLNTIGRDNRVIFVRRFWYGDSVADIAKDTGISENSVSVRLHRIRGKLKDYLEKEGLYE